MGNRISSRVGSTATLCHCIRPRPEPPRSPRASWPAPWRRAVPPSARTCALAAHHPILPANAEQDRRACWRNTRRPYHRKSLDSGHSLRRFQAVDICGLRLGKFEDIIVTIRDCFAAASEGSARDRVPVRTDRGAAPTSRGLSTLRRAVALRVS